MKRVVLLLAVLALLAPALLAALQGCMMAECGVTAVDPHACCRTDATRLVAGCCEHDDHALETDAVPAGGPDRRAGQPPATAAVTSTDGIGVVASAASTPAEPAPSPPRDLLSRHCILRI